MNTLNLINNIPFFATKEYTSRIDLLQDIINYNCTHKLKVMCCYLGDSNSFEIKLIDSKYI